MEGSVTSDQRTDDAVARIQRARVAMRTNRWWETRMLLGEAQLQADWSVLGYESLEAYTADVLATASHQRKPTKRG